MFYSLAYSKIIHWLRVAVWGACEQWSLPQALISFPGASGMTSGFGSLPGVMCVLLDLFTSWLGPKCLHREGSHMFIRFVFQGIVLRAFPPTCCCSDLIVQLGFCRFVKFRGYMEALLGWGHALLHPHICSLTHCSDSPPAAVLASRRSSRLSLSHIPFRLVSEQVGLCVG